MSDSPKDHDSSLQQFQRLLTLDTLYTQFLTAGFILLREAAHAGDHDWLNAEIELLHNVPSLIGETNFLRYEYFWEKERATFYDPFWKEMAPLIASMKPTETHD